MTVDIQNIIEGVRNFTPIWQSKAEGERAVKFRHLLTSKIALRIVVASSCGPINAPIDHGLNSFRPLD